MAQPWRLCQQILVRASTWYPASSGGSTSCSCAWTAPPAHGWQNPPLRSKKKGNYHKLSRLLNAALLLHFTRSYIVTSQHLPSSNGVKIPTSLQIRWSNQGMQWDSPILGRLKPTAEFQRLMWYTSQCYRMALHLSTFRIGSRMAWLWPLISSSLPEAI